ncbi:MAG: cation transporter [Candidatus Dormibacterales bacterium]
MDATRSAAARRGLGLELAGAAWMLVEAVIALSAGVLAGSVLLIAFGLDSVIELLSGAVLVRRLSFEARGATSSDVERLERGSARVSAVLLLLLCIYIVITSLAGLVLHIRPAGSPVGMAVTAVALVFMPLLAVAKGRVNRVLESASLRADIAETASCAFLAATTLVGLAAGSLLNLWWVQYVAAFALLVWLVPEAREAMEGWSKAPEGHSR